MFQKRFGRYPNTLKEMFENRPRTIRKLWKDPMCRCDNWKPLILGAPDTAALRTGAGAGGTSTGLPPPPPTPTPGAFGTPAASSGPIAGVRSQVHEQALREWRGFKYYDQWAFLAGDADSDRLGGAPASGGLPGPLMPTKPPQPPQ